jgi:GAF domain-containing protein
MQTDVELRRRLAALESLQRVTREITATVDLDYILSEVLAEAVRFSAAEAGMVLRFEEGATSLRTHQGYTEESLADIQAILQEQRFGSSMGALVEKQESVYLADVAALPDAELYPAGARTLW